MSRESNLFRHNSFKTRTLRVSAGDDALADVPDAVTSFTATADGASAMDLAWSNPAGNTNSVVQIERSPTDNQSYAVIAYVDAADEAYADSGLSAATAYFYRVTVIRRTDQTATQPEANDTTTA